MSAEAGVELTGGVYFVQAADGGGCIKIGKAQDFVARLKQLQSFSPVRLAIIGRAVGGLALERALHRHLAVHRSHGEWFYSTPETLEAMRLAIVDPIGFLRMYRPRHWSMALTGVPPMKTLLLVLSMLVMGGCASSTDSSPRLGGVRSWHDDARGVTCWIVGTWQHGIAMSCLPDSVLRPDGGAP